jgi:hypothetical protein
MDALGAVRVYKYKYIYMSLGLIPLQNSFCCFGFGTIFLILLVS